MKSACKLPSRPATGVQVHSYQNGLDGGFLAGDARAQVPVHAGASAIYSPNGTQPRRYFY
jgi:hypothetical protein